MTGKLNCSDVHAFFDVSQPTVSHHLKELSMAGVVQREKQGQFCYYHVKSETLTAYVAVLQLNPVLSNVCGCLLAGSTCSEKIFFRFDCSLVRWFLLGCKNDL